MQSDVEKFLKYIENYKKLINNLKNETKKFTDYFSCSFARRSRLQYTIMEHGQQNLRTRDYSASQEIRREHFGRCFSSNETVHRQCRFRRACQGIRVSDMKTVYKYIHKQNRKKNKKKKKLR